MSCSFIIVINKSVSEALRDCNHFNNNCFFLFVFIPLQIKEMNYNTSLREKTADMADTDSSKIDVVLNPSSREHREIPPEFPDHLYLPSLGSRSLEHVENKKFQGKETYNKNCQMTSGILCEGSSL